VTFQALPLQARMPQYCLRLSKYLVTLSATAALQQNCFKYEFSCPFFTQDTMLLLTFCTATF